MTDRLTEVESGLLIAFARLVSEIVLERQACYWVEEDHVLMPGWCSTSCGASLRYSEIYYFCPHCGGKLKREIKEAQN